MVELVALIKPIDPELIDHWNVIKKIIDDGDCRGFAVVAMHKSGEVTTVVTKNDDQFRLLAGVERLAYRINESMN
jgi:hypothetical protein